MDENQNTDVVGSTPPFPPPGFVDRHEAARMFGVAVGTWGTWERQGRVSGGLMVPIPGTSTRTKLYRVEDLRRLLEEFAKGPAFPPAGFVDRHEAVRMLGMPERTFWEWEKRGRINCGRLVSTPGLAAQRKVYPVEALRRLAEEFEREAEALSRRLEPYPDPDRPGVVRVPVASAKHEGLEALIDAADLPLAAGKRWNWSGGRAGGAGASVVIPGVGSLARMIMGVADDAERLVCHVTGDRLDCRRENLIVRTRSESRRAARRPAKWDRFGEPYPDPDRPGVMRVPVCSDKHEGMEAIIDAASLPLVQGKRLNWGPGKREGEGWVVLVHNRTFREALHQAVMGVRGKENRVGHLNGDPLDCRRENLVVRTASEQKAATGKIMSKAGKPCSSRYKGVSRVSPTARWTVSIKAHGELRQLGRFRSELGAALAYDDAARELFGVHAQLNFSNPDEIVRMRAIALEEENAAPPPFPPPEFIDRRGAYRMFGVGPAAWTHWEQTGRVRCGQWAQQPLAKQGGKCRIYPIDELNRLLEEFNNVGKPYPDPDWRGCWRVPIRSMIHRMEAIIDADDLPVVEGKHWNWSARSDGSHARVTLATTGKSVQLARIIARVTDAEMKVSHVNRDPLDCRRANLIVRTMAEQAPGNRKMGTVSGRKYTSNFKGVSWDSSREKWHVQITKGEIHRYIGRFSDEIAAAEAYDDAARELFGEHAYLNFPDGVDAWLEAQATRMERAEAA